MLEVKPLKYKKIEGLSERQLSEHHDVLYAGYVKKYNEIDEKLKTVDLESTNATYSDIRELQVEKSFALNGVRLHELYFDNMTDSSQECTSKVKELIEKKWGSVEKWAKQFVAMGVASRGWVVLAWDYQTAELDNYLCDIHNQGGIWATVPILVLDVYEHAYFLDYATARKDYITSFMKAIDWQVVNDRINSNIHSL